MPGGSRQGCTEQGRIFEGLAKGNFGSHAVLSGTVVHGIVFWSAIPDRTTEMVRPGIA